MLLYRVGAFRTLLGVDKQLPDLLSKISTAMLNAPSRYISHSVQSLPKLPVPPLQQSVQLYLRYLKPLVSLEQWHEAKKEMERFCERSDEGPLLQSLLEKRAQRLDNWLVDWWLYTAYLDCRLPLPINVSPGIRFPERRFSSNQEWLWFAASLLEGAVNFYRILSSNKLSTDKLAGQDLCMAQYHSCLGTCRIPGFIHDSLVHTKTSSHVIVAFKGNFYSIEVINRITNESLSIGDIFCLLEGIINDSSAHDRKPRVGILTTLPRDHWAVAHRRLMAFSSNRLAMQQIQQSLMLLALDDSVERSHGEDMQQSPTHGALNALHGGGSDINSENRWFDKTLQLIVSRDGTSGFNYEHSPAEGPPIVQLVDLMFHRLQSANNAPTNDAKRITASESIPPAKLLQWSTDLSIEEDVEVAKRLHNEAVRNLRCQVLIFTEFGKNVPKSHKVSPDAFIQVALQLAYRKLHGSDTATYESGTLRRFYLGRTDTIRSCSPESSAFCNSVLNEDGLEKQVELFRAAVNAHRMYTDAVVSGNGYDRHFLGLRLIAKDNNLSEPSWARSASYQKALHYRLSTSQVPATTPVTLLFGPVVSDGYGICYNPQEKEFNITITDYQSCKETDCHRLADELTDAFRYLRRLLESASPRAQNENLRSKL